MRAVGRDVRDAAESGAEDRREPMENVFRGGRRKRAAAGAILKRVKASWEAFHLRYGYSVYRYRKYALSEITDYLVYSWCASTHSTHTEKTFFYGTYW